VSSLSFSCLSWIQLQWLYARDSLNRNILIVHLVNSAAKNGKLHLNAWPFNSASKLHFGGLLFAKCTRWHLKSSNPGPSLWEIPHLPQPDLAAGTWCRPFVRAPAFPLLVFYEMNTDVVCEFAKWEQMYICVCTTYTGVLHIQEWLDTQCQDTVSLAILWTSLHAWNQLAKVGFLW